jgi:hypothetical protein
VHRCNSFSSHSLQSNRQIAKELYLLVLLKAYSALAASGGDSMGHCVSAGRPCIIYFDLDNVYTWYLSTAPSIINYSDGMPAMILFVLDPGLWYLFNAKRRLCDPEILVVMDRINWDEHGLALTPVVVVLWWTLTLGHWRWERGSVPVKDSNT